MSVLENTTADIATDDTFAPNQYLLATSICIDLSMMNQNQCQYFDLLFCLFLSDLVKIVSGDPTLLLSQVAVKGAEFDSREREPHPKCLFQRDSDETSHPHPRIIRQTGEESIDLAA
jgi:hypothetical protein